MVRREQPAIGDAIAGRYQVEEVLGQGGMGAVYRVRDRRGGQICALKRSSASDPRKAQRRSALLEHEYHTLVQLAHPRIIEVYEYGVDDAGPYYTMELLDGADLDKGGRLPWKEACALLYDVASSLSILHARGLIHRDVSLRNVRRTPEGRAKLIDFGAMTAMGAAKDVVGTPPFVAPEVLQMQELDGRADLFSLGALGYYMLTGRNAYPARRFAELRDVWRSRPMTPLRLAPDVPEGLSALIMQLLALDRSARPRSAAEVMERLSGLAGLPMEERVEVSRAYLTTPALVGRDRALVLARREILSLVRRDGGCLLMEGLAGSGRSRMLDACVLEGKLLGATVLRADAGDAVSDWGVARALCAQLIELMPKEAAEAARLSQHVLGHVIDGFGPDVVLSARVPERSVLLRELRDFVLAFAHSQRLLIVVDDIDHIDEPSAALLAAIAHKTEHHALLLVLALERSAEPTGSASLRLLRLVAKTVEIEALSAEQTAALVRSIFGDVPNVEFVAGRIHALAQGNPRATLDLVQHLVERGFARYEAGSWLLPTQLEEGELPNTLAAAFASRLAKLSSDARALIEMLALADGDAFALSEYPELVVIADHRRVFAALDELLAARVLTPDGEGYRFSQRGFLPVLRATIGDERTRVAHGRIAGLLGKRGGSVISRAHHLLYAEHDREAIALLMSIDLTAQLPPVALLEKALECAERHGFPKRTLNALRMAILAKSSLALAGDSFRSHLPSVLMQLEHDTGLTLYRQLAHLPPEERLQKALAAAQERYLATPESERVYDVLGAIRELARLSGAVCSFAMQLFELELLESLPSLEPLTALSPAIRMVGQIVLACKEWLVGRGPRHRQICSEIVERIEQPDRGGLDENQHRRTLYGLHYAMALFEASLGISAVEARCAALESQREHRVNAWRLRMTLHLSQGNLEEAKRCERRAEVLALQQSGEQSYSGMGGGFEIVALAELGDLLGVKSRVDVVSVLAERYPGWHAWHAYGQGRYRWLQGDAQGALDAVMAGLELAPPLRHCIFLPLAGLRVRLLVALGRIEEAVAIGREYAELCEREQLTAADFGIFMGYAQALSAAGDHHRAVEVIESIIVEGEQLGRAGLGLGVLYEVRARIALAMEDRAAFERFAELCAQEFKRARNPTLAARFASLLEDANRHALGELSPSPDVRELLQAQTADSEYNTVHSRILECIDENDRARCALTLLLQSTDSGSGYLYGVGREVTPHLLAALPELPVDAEVTAWVEECLKAELETGEAATGDDLESATRSDVARRYTDSDGRSLEPTFLISQRRPPQLAAVLVVSVAGNVRARPPRALLEELAEALLEHGDVTGVPLADSATDRS